MNGKVIRCFGCGAGVHIVHFNLLVSRKNAEGKQISRGAGSINLCQKCWLDACRSSARISRRRERRKVPVT